jgi:hypothetical protein
MLNILTVDRLSTKMIFRAEVISLHYYGDHLHTNLLNYVNRLLVIDTDYNKSLGLFTPYNGDGHAADKYDNNKFISAKNLDSGVYATLYQVYDGEIKEMSVAKCGNIYGQVRAFQYVGTMPDGSVKGTSKNSVYAD